MKRYHEAYRCVLWSYAILFIGWVVSGMLHANPTPSAQVVAEITTLVVGSWFVVRGFYVGTKADAPEGVEALLLPAAVIYGIWWFVVGATIIAVS